MRLSNVPSNTLEEGLFCVQLIESSVDQIHTKHADSLLLKNVGGIPQVDMQHYVVRLASGLCLEAQTYPAMRLIRSGMVTGGDRINKAEETSPGSPTFVQLTDELNPLPI
jgi:hypothetical protein